MLEAGVILDLKGNPLHWHEPKHSSVFIPDSRDLWQVFWENRDNLSGFAHSHPGSGRTSPSDTDRTTFKAVEAGLGKRLDWWITTSDTMILARYHSFVDDYLTVEVNMQPDWLIKLREISTYGE
jgi:proteasome lid subunit RPN8/RPN11